MANEGQFLKVDGDILYASEVNRFQYYGGIFAGSTQSAGSGTGYLSLGSLFVSGNIINANSAVLHHTFTTSLEGGTTTYFRIFISGTTGNFAKVLGSVALAVGVGTIDIPLSTVGGSLMAIQQYSYVGGGGGSAAIYTDYAPTGNFNPGSNFIVEWQVNSADVGAHKLQWASLSFMRNY